MPYNIDNWKQKECRDFVLTKAAVEELIKAGASFQLRALESDTAVGKLPTTVTGLSEGFEITGFINQDGETEVSSIISYGEASGSSMDILLSILEKSRGYYEAVLVWEGGDTIERLIIQDGQTSVVNIEL